MPCVAEVVNRSLKADCTDFTEISLPLTSASANYKTCSPGMDFVMGMCSYTWNILYCVKIMNNESSVCVGQVINGQHYI